MPSKIDSFPTTCMLCILLSGLKRNGYEVVKVFANQQDDLEIVINTYNGLKMHATLEVTCIKEGSNIE